MARFSISASATYLDQVLAGLWRAYLSVNPPQEAIPRKLLLPTIDDTATSSNSTPLFLSIETKSKWDDWAKTAEARRFERAVIAYRQE